MNKCVKRLGHKGGGRGFGKKGRDEEVEPAVVIWEEGRIKKIMMPTCTSIWLDHEDRLV